MAKNTGHRRPMADRPITMRPERMPRVDPYAAARAREQQLRMERDAGRYRMLVKVVRHLAVMAALSLTGFLLALWLL